jgi:hypothetical protein
MTNKLDLLKPGGARAKQLTSLARAINSGQDAIASLESATCKSGYALVCEIRLQGQRLLELKEMVGHGRWLEWLKANCPLVSDRNARRYMRAASNRPVLADLDDAATLGQALRIAAGGGPSDLGVKEKPKSWPPFLEALGRFGKFAGYVERNPLHDWPQAGLDKLRDDMAPIATALWPERFKVAA